MPQRFKEKLVDWQVMVDNLAPRLTDFPYLAADHAALAKVLRDAQGLENEQEMARVAFEKVNASRRALAKQGARLRNRLAHGLRGLLSPDSTELQEFRIKPQRPSPGRPRLTPLEKAERAAARARARLEAAKAEEKPAPPAPSQPPAQ